MAATSFGPYRVEAYNTAKASDNKIHDDAVASRFGFRGGLVPGVDVYAYMMHPLVAQWGRAWLERGTVECRFDKPVYDGEIVEVNVVPDGDAYAITVNSRGLVCASGHASLPLSAPPTPDPGRAVAVAEHRPPADEISLAAGTWLGMTPLEVTAESAASYLLDVRETHPLFPTEGLIHPGMILRACNWVVKQNVVLGPWIHAGSKVQNLGCARTGDTLSARALVLRNYTHKGHKFIELDVLVLSNGNTPAARILHTAIYQPRQVA